MQKTKRPLSLLLAVVMIIGMFASVPFTASAAVKTVTITAADFEGYVDIYDDDNERTTSAKGVVIEVVENAGGNFYVSGDWFHFYNDSRYVIRMEDGSLITNIALIGEDIDGTTAGDGWSGFEWSNPQGAASVQLTGQVEDIETMRVTYIAEGAPTTKTITIFASDFDFYLDIYDGESTTVKGVVIELGNDSNFSQHGDTFEFYCAGEYVIRMEDGSLITNIELGNIYYLSYGRHARR